MRGSNPHLLRVGRAFAHHTARAVVECGLSTENTKNSSDDRVPNP